MSSNSTQNLKKVKPRKLYFSTEFNEKTKKIHDGRQGENSKLPQVLNHVRIGISDEEI